MTDEYKTDAGRKADADSFVAALRQFNFLQRCAPGVARPAALDEASERLAEATAKLNA